jgi:hypothetical protein
MSRRSHRSAAAITTVRKEISALSDAELAAAFGTRDVASKSPSSNASQYEEEISALTPAQLAAAYGAGVYSTGPVWTPG